MTSFHEVEGWILRSGNIFKLSFSDARRLIEKVPILKKLKVLTLLNLLPLRSYVSLWLLKPFPNRSTYHVYIWYIFVCKFWDAYLVFFMTIYAVSLGSSSFIFVDSMPYPSYKFVGAKFLESGNLLSDSYTLIHILARLTIYTLVNVYVGLPVAT